MATRFLKIEKEAYERSLQKLHEAELQQRVAYLQGVFVFSDWSDDDLYKLAYVMSSRRYEKNATIIAQGETTDSLFFVKAGTRRVLKRLVLSARHQLMLGSPRGAPRSAARRRRGAAGGGIRGGGGGGGEHPRWAAGDFGGGGGAPDGASSRWASVGRGA